VRYPNVYGIDMPAASELIAHGRDAEQMVSQLVLTDSLPDQIRINIIRSMGYIPSTSFLIPLRRILESNENLRLRKAAIISISKYNDKRALNMLNAALQRINNPILQDSISSEISRIKKDNPILSLMPKFLNGVNDPKTFRTTLEVLKQILNPSDAQVFIYHLNSETPFVGDGAFEVLCWRGDESVKFSIFDFFRKKLELIDNIADLECYSLQDLIGKVEQFIVRNPLTINYILKELKTIYKNTGDVKVKDILINMFSSSRKREVLSFLEDVYNTEPGRREHVIEKLVGNEEGAYILIYKYKNDPEMKKPLLMGLMTTLKGADFISENFDSMDPGWQKLVLDNINDDNYQYFKTLIERFLNSHDSGQKKFALENIKNNQDTRFRKILFAEENVDEFLRMQSDYIDAIVQLCSIQAFKLLINKMINEKTARAMIRRYLAQEELFINAEPVLVLHDTDDLSNFINKLIKFNNKDLNIEILEIFYNLKSLDHKTFSKLQNVIEEFKNLRGARIHPDEKGMVNKINSNYLNVSADLKKIDSGKTNIHHFIEKAFPDYELLEYLLKTHPYSFFVHREELLERIGRVFKLTNDIDAFDTIKYFLRRPQFCRYYKEEIKRATQSTNYLLKNDADKLMETMPRDLRFILRFSDENKKYDSVIQDQLYELMPEFEVDSLNTTEILPSDLLITDTASVQELASQNILNTKKLFVIIKSNDEFVSIKELNPKVFPLPFSLNKLVKAIIPELFPVS